MRTTPTHTRARARTGLHALHQIAGVSRTLTTITRTLNSMIRTLTTITRILNSMIRTLNTHTHTRPRTHRQVGTRYNGLQASRPEGL
jgi:hypothetical protein